MSEKRSLLAPTERLIERARSPIPHARPIVAIVDLHQPKWMVDALTRALVLRGATVARLAVAVRAREGSEQVGDHVRASADAMRAALEGALTALPAHDLLVVEGAAAVALLDTRLALLGSPASVLALPPDVRALRAAFDLVLFSERAAALDGIAALLWPSALGATA